jgi:heterodisulfide reductase subunit A
MASAAAAKTLVLFGSDILEREPIVAKVDESTCAGCFYCKKVCPYNAIEMKEIRNRAGELIKTIAYVNTGLCQGCGTCNATCPSKSVQLLGFRDDQIFAELFAFADN